MTAHDAPTSALSRFIDDDDAAGWTQKAQSLIDPWRPAIVAAGGRSARVATRAVEDPATAGLGRFMLSWPEADGDDFVLYHLRDGGFFLRLLVECYAPVLADQPQRGRVVTDGSRLEVAITNDVLQVQAAGPPGDYSMIRHHALMLLIATEWLGEPARSRWLALYSDIAAAARAGGAPPAARLDAVEDEAFAEMRQLAAGASDAGSSAELLAEPGRLQCVLLYQWCAAVAVGLLAGQWARAPEQQRDEWLERQLIEGYRSDNYLIEDWDSALSRAGRR